MTVSAKKQMLVIGLGATLFYFLLGAALAADLPATDPNLFGVIGMSTGSAVLSNVIVDTKMRESPGTPAAVGDPTLVGRIDKNVSPQDASWADLYLGEEEANRSTVDVSRLQKFVTTYAQMLWLAFSQSSSQYEAFTMPFVGSNFLILLAASHAAYIAYKATLKTPTTSRRRPANRRSSSPPAAPPAAESPQAAPPAADKPASQ